MPSTIGLRKEQALSSDRLVDPAESPQVGADGSVTIPAALAARMGLNAHDGLILAADARGVQLSSDSLRRIYVEASGICNLACVTCVRNTWVAPGELMPLERFRRLLSGLPDDGREPPILAFGGFGEPLAHPELPEMVRLARERGCQIEITTNGTLLDRATAGSLLDAGLAQVTVSVDGSDEASYSGVRRRELAPVLANLALLTELRRKARSRLRVGLAFVAMRRNIRALPELLGLATRLDLDFVTVSNVVPHTRELEREILWPRAAWAASFPPASWRPSLQLAQLDVDDDTRPVLEAIWRQAGTMPPPTFNNDSWQPWRERRNHCRFTHEGTVVVGWDGSVAPCLSLLHDHPEYINGHHKDIKRYVVGHVDEQRLSDIWRSPGYRHFRARVRAFDFPSCFICGGCPNTESNQEDCYGNAFPVCGECLWAQGIVLCP